MIPLTSGQVQDGLDNLLNFAISLVIENSTIVQNSMPALVSFAAIHKRRKIDRLGSHLILKHGTGFIVNGPTVKRYLACKFNRQITYQLVKQYLNATDKYIPIPGPNLKPEQEIKKTKSSKLKFNELSATKDFDNVALYINPVRANVEDALNAYDTFRSELLASYTPLCCKEALLLRNKSSLPVSVDDLKQNLQQAVLYALDRFDSEKGALTSFIQQWMRHFFQSPEFGHSVGLAFNTSHFARRQIARKISGVQNIGYNLTPKALGSFQPIDSAEDELLKAQEKKLLVIMLQKIDPLGLLRTLHQVEEQWTPAHQEQKDRLYANARPRKPAASIQPERSSTVPLPEGFGEDY